MAKLKPGPKKGSKKSAAHKKKLANAVIGDKNGRYKDGRRSYRRIAGAKPGDVVMHLDNNRNNNKPSNLKISKGKRKGTTTTSEHEKRSKRGQGRKPGSKNKKRTKLSTSVRDYKLYGTTR